MAFQVLASATYTRAPAPKGTCSREPVHGRIIDLPHAGNSGHVSDLSHQVGLAHDSARTKFSPRMGRLAGGSLSREEGLRPPTPASALVLSPHCGKQARPTEAAPNS